MRKKERKLKVKSLGDDEKEQVRKNDKKKRWINVYKL